MANLSSFVTGQAVSASTEKSYIRAPDSAVGSLWVSSGLGVSVSTESVLANLPEGSNKKTAIKIQRASGTDYVRYRFTLDQADSGKTFKIAWNQIYAGSAGDYTLSVFSYTDASYTLGATNLNAVASSIPATTGGFLTTVSMPTFSSAPYIEVRINAISGTTPIYISGVSIGPGTLAAGALVSEWTSYIPVSTQGWGSVTGTAFFYMRVGSSIVVKAKFTAGTPTASEARISLPTGLTSGTTNTLTMVASYARDASAATDNQVYIEPSVSYLTFGRADGTVTGYTKRAGNIVAGVGETIGFTTALIPIAEWAGSGTTLISSQVTDVEYVFNTSTSLAADDSVSFGIGPQGAQIQNITGSLFRRVQFSYPIQQDDLIIVELSEDRTSWTDSSNFFSNASNTAQVTGYTIQNGTSSGIGRIKRVSSTQIDIFFGQYSYANSTYGAAGQTWATGGGSLYWRVRKAKAVAPVGLSASSSGSGGSGFILSTKTANFTAASLNHYLVDTSVTAIIATLPAGATSSTIKFSDAQRTWSSRTLTIQPATGERIDGLAVNEAVVADVTGASIQLSWDGAKWVLDTNALATNLIGGSGGLAPTAITTTTAAIKGKYYLANTSGGSFTATLPVGTTDAYIRFADANDTWDSFPLTIAPATGEQINGYAANDTLVCNVKGGWVDLAWNGSRWVLSSSNSSTVSPATSTTYGTVSGGTLPSAISAPAQGFHGEYRESMGTIGSISSTTYTTVGNAGLTLTPGVYELQATAQITPAPTTTLLNMLLHIGTTNTADNTGQDVQRGTYSSFHGNITNPNGDSWRIATPLYRVVVTTTTTYYPKIYIGFGTSTCQAITNIFSRRI